MSHYLIDCENYILTSRLSDPVDTSPSRNHLKLIANSATVFQTFEAAHTLVKEFQLKKYAIIYENHEKTYRSDYFKQFADDFSHKLSLNGNEASMLFKTAISDVNLAQLVKKHKNNLDGK